MLRIANGLRRPRVRRTLPSLAGVEISGLTLRRGAVPFRRVVTSVGKSKQALRADAVEYGSWRTTCDEHRGPPLLLVGKLQACRHCPRASFLSIASAFRRWAALLYNDGIAPLPPLREPSRPGGSRPPAASGRFRPSSRANQVKERNRHGSNSSVLHRSSRCRACRRRRRRPLLPDRPEGAHRCGHASSQPCLRRGPHDDRRQRDLRGRFDRV